MSYFITPRIRKKN